MESPLHQQLANPMWTALSTTHAPWAQCSGALKRFVPEVAPFCAVEHEGTEIAQAGLLHPGEHIYFLGTIPVLPRNCSVVYDAAVLQMVFAGAAPHDNGSDRAPVLGPADLPAMLALTALVYPEFFRPRTPALGQYIGIRRQGGLAAMAGQRLACPGYREISAVCTHPEQRGQGHAARLIRQLSQAILADGDTPFLHVSASNSAAWKLYENLGFVASRELRFVKWLVT